MSNSAHKDLNGTSGDSGAQSDSPAASYNLELSISSAASENVARADTDSFAGQEEPVDEKAFSFLASSENKEKCENHLREVSEAYERWQEDLKRANSGDDESFAFLHLTSAMKAFHSAVSSAVRAEPFFRNLQEEANKVEEEMILYNKSPDKCDTAAIAKVIEEMYRHFCNQCSVGNPCAVSEGGDAELLRYGDLAMKKVFDHTKMMSNSMNDVVQMIEKKILLETEYTKQLNKLAMEHKNALEHMTHAFPFKDVLTTLVGYESDYCSSMSETHQRLLQNRFVAPLKARIKDFEEVTGELHREWNKKRVYYEKAKENSKDAHNRYYKACIDLDRELAKIPMAEKSRIAEKEQAKKKCLEEFEHFRRQQSCCYEELSKKRQWVLATTLNVVWQAEKKLQSALGHFFSNYTAGFQQRPLIYKSLLSVTLSKSLNHNETMIYDILYRDSEIESTKKDLELEFENKINPFEKDVSTSTVSSKTPRESGSRGGNFLKDAFGALTFKYPQHNYEKMSPDDTRFFSKCFECHEYVYEGSVCTKCSFVLHTEHIAPGSGGKPMKYPNCDQLKDKPPPLLRFFRRTVEEQPKTADGNPVFFDHCLSLVEQHYIKEQGLYRQEGVRKKASQLCDKIEDDISSVSEADISDHKVISMVIKHYIRVIPRSLLDERFFDSWMTLGADIVKSNERGERCPSHVVPGIIYNLQSIHASNRRAANVLFLHLRKVASFSHFNNMNSTNLGIVFGPNLIRKTKVDHSAADPANGFSAKDNKEHTDYLKSVTSFMIDNYEQIFESEALCSSLTKSGSSASSAVDVNRTSQLSCPESDGTYVSVDQFATNASLKRLSDVSTGATSVSSSEQFPTIDEIPTSATRSRAGAQNKPSTTLSDLDVNSGDQRGRKVSPSMQGGVPIKTTSNYELR